MPPMPQTLDPSAKLTITLTAAEWNVVLGQLAEGPYRIVAPLMKSITDQGMAHLPAAAAPANGLAQGDSAHVPDR
jgi:hypothetical protein